MKTLPAVDVAIVGGGWAGLLMAKELGSRTALAVVVLERGIPRETSDYASAMDELDYAIRGRMMQDLSRETVTIRHSRRQRALPMRQYGSFLPGTGLGGAGEHWGGGTNRLLPDCFELRSRMAERYGTRRLPEGHSIQDWGTTYAEMEPYYARAERLLGASGKAGNLRGKLIAGGNIFEGWRSSEYPAPPTKTPYVSDLFRDAAVSLGYHPFPAPAATLSVPYTNPDGVARPGCTYCGYCERFGCMIGAKAQPTNTLLPLIKAYKSVAIRTQARVRRILYDGNPPNRRVRGVSYQDAGGEEVVQPAELVILASWTLNNTRLLLLSGIGAAYDPSTGRGNLGRNLTHQLNVPAATGFFDQPLNRFMGSGGAGYIFADLDGDVFDHHSVSFLRGGVLGCTTSGNRPIANFGVVPKSVGATWGSAWKKAAIRYYDRVGAIGFGGEHLAYRDNYLDLDPNYYDAYGDPLLRLTLDWHENERQLVAFASTKAIEIMRAMGANDVIPHPGLGHYDARVYQSTHLQGGTIMGKSPEVSVLNPYLQHWQVPNLFVLGASGFPQEPAAGPTLTVLAMSYRTADALVDRYLKKPEALA